MTSLETYFHLNYSGCEDLLDDWGLMLDGHNPIARTNIAPQVHPPDTASLYGFPYTMPKDNVGRSTFVVVGAGDLRDQADLSAEAI